MFSSRSPLGLALALATMVAVPAACSDGTASSPEQPPATSTQPQGSPSSSAANSSEWTPIPVANDDSLPGGRLGMTANGRVDAPWAVVAVPEGFSTLGGWVIFDESPQGGAGIGYWTVSEVVRNPCGNPEPMDAGTTVEDLVSAFQQQRLTRMTPPVPVTVDDYEGLSLELRVPEGIDFAACPEFNLWESDPAGARHMGGPGEFDRLWILDVAGDVVVLTVTAEPGVSKAALDRLTTMVEAVEFVPRSS